MEIMLLINLKLSVVLCNNNKNKVPIFTPVDGHHLYFLN